MIRGFTCGAFDLLHPGHIYLLQAASEQCDELWVGLHTDPTIDRPEKNKPIQTTFERHSQLAAVKFVQGVIPYDTENDLRNILATCAFNVRFIGSDYISKQITGEDICSARGMKIVFIDRFHDWSSSSLRERIQNAKG
jgi:glycerol-3-phosphate cytidylyltransferase